MKVVFDPEKDEANKAKHGISLVGAGDMIIAAVRPDPYPHEPRLRAYGTIAGKRFCLIYVERDGRVRAISLRRAHSKEYDRHVTGH